MEGDDEGEERTLEVLCGGIIDIDTDTDEEEEEDDDDSVDEAIVIS